MAGAPSASVVVRLEADKVIRVWATLGPPAYVNRFVSVCREQQETTKGFKHGIVFSLGKISLASLGV